MRDLTARVNYLYDRAMITDTIHRFFMALDEKAWGDIPELLADEFLLSAATVIGQAPRRQPVDEFIEGLIARNGGFAGTTHLNPGHIIDIEGDKAHVKAHMYCPHWVDDTDAGMYLAYGRYYIDLVREGEKWLLTDLIIHIDGARGDAKAVYTAAAERVTP
ncbi:nuclear transport factor 2 family protein [Streptomyces griseoaurantiacus]|uniref:nuclear transport factor 2 family protein n=1 Tax=Streptomyces griseoaurantiacus TaxID=68213 RepID=UPI00352D98FC